MISLDIKAKNSTSSSPLNILPEKEVSIASFSELLKGVSLQKDDKIIQNGSLVLSLQENTLLPKNDVKPVNNDSLLSLLKHDSKDIQKPQIDKNTNNKVIQDVAEVNPIILDSLSVNEVKVLMKDAREYLKSKIIASEDFKKFEVKNLPKTLKGLIQVAQKFGVDLSKITLEDVKNKPQVDKKLLVNTLTASTPTVKGKKETSENKTDVVRNIQQDKSLKVLKDVKSTPLFKAQGQQTHTTEQIVQTKLASIEPQQAKKKSDETLKALLNGDKAQKSDTTLTADMSVATAKVIAPQVTTKTIKTLESLLKNDTGDTSDVVKIDGLNTPKADSLEVKVNEAKQMTKYLSQDVKTAIEDYKAPFTRIKVQLNPQKLGEVELTIIQRGKNLHINLSSNNAAINTLSANANDLKVQLQNSGINNASLNFSNNAQSDNSAANQQQQQRQNEQKAHNEYNYFESEETNEEILSSLEIVVPHYA